jgi:hypothetical protein
MTRDQAGQVIDKWVKESGTSEPGPGGMHVEWQGKRIWLNEGFTLERLQAYEIYAGKKSPG